MEIFLSAFEMGLIFSIMSLGIFITFKILNLPDLTIDGSYTLGASVGAVFILSSHPYIGLIVATFLGVVSGIITGLIHTKLGIDPILSGILTMTGLYSINLRIMNKPSISVFGKNDIYKPFVNIFGPDYTKLIVNLLFLIIIGILLYCFFKTQLGVSLIATGDNEDMVRASSINSVAMKILGLALGNGLVALSGAIMVSYSGFADISSGTGMMIIGIASIIVGEAILGRSSLFICFIGVAIGSIIYRYLLSIAFNAGLEAGDLKLLSSILVIIAVGLPSIKKLLRGKKNVKNK